MYHCPRCRDEVVPDPKNHGKYLCYRCKKRYDGAVLARLEQSTAQSQAENYDDPFEQYDEHVSNYPPPNAAQRIDDLRNEVYITDVTGRPGTATASAGSVEQQQQYSKENSRIQIIAIVLAILSLPIIIPFYLSALFGIVAIVLSIRGLISYKKYKTTPKTPYIVSLVLSILGTIACIIMLALFCLNLAGVLANEDDYYQEANYLYEDATGNYNDDYYSLFDDDYNFDDEFDQDYSYGSNTNSGFNSITDFQSNSQSSNSNSKGNLPQDALNITFMGQKFNLFNTTVGDFENRTGWKFSAYENRMFEPGDGILGSLHSPEDTFSSISVSIDNKTDSIKDAQGCNFTMFVFSPLGGNDCGFSVGDGIKIGTPYSVVIEKLGEPITMPTTSQGISTLSYSNDQASLHIDFDDAGNAKQFSFLFS